MISSRYTNDGKAIIPLNRIQEEYISVYRKKCEKGVYTFENIGCECGNKTSFDILAEKDRYGLPAKTVICKKCGLIMLNPRMSSESYQEFYKTEYPYIYRAIETPDDAYFEKRVEYGRYLVHFIEEKAKVSGVEMLEIGCAGGGIVRAFEESGYNSIGVDLSEKYIQYGKNKGLNLRCCNSRDLLVENKVYDIIILNHVLEHFTNISEELEVIKKLLKPEVGILFVAVPGVKDLIYSYDNDFLKLLQNAHTYVFSQSTLGQVVAQCGFELIYGNEKVEAIFRVSKSHKDTANNYDDIINFLYALERGELNGYSIKAQRVKDIVMKYEKGEVVLYGVGKESEKLINYIGKCQQIRGFATKDSDSLKKFLGYPVLSLEQEIGVKCIIISSRIYGRIIYDRIKYLEKRGIRIIRMYE